jgi:hypothetical protein
MRIRAKSAILGLLAGQAGAQYIAAAKVLHSIFYDPLLPSLSSDDGAQAQKASRK